MSYSLGRTLRQVVLHNGEILGVLLYWPLLFSFWNQRYFPITNIIVLFYQVLDRLIQKGIMFPINMQSHQSFSGRLGTYFEIWE